MRKSTTLKALATAVALIVGCSPIYTSHDYDPDANFASYTSFSWMENQDVEKANQAKAGPFANDRIHKNIDKELSGKGLARQDDGGDLLVIYYLNGKQVTEVMRTSYGGADMWASARVGGGDAVVTEVNEGMIIIDLLDAKSKTLVWRGTGENAMKADASTEEIYNQLDKVIKKVMGEYPPK